jgi:hypothetical protein
LLSGFVCGQDRLAPFRWQREESCLRCSELALRLLERPILLRATGRGCFLFRLRLRREGLPELAKQQLEVFARARGPEVDPKERVWLYAGV